MAIATFNGQLSLGRQGEIQVMQHLKSLPETKDVIDLHDKEKYQKNGIDGLWLYESNNTFFATFFDVKTDFYINKTKNIFLETITNNHSGNLMSSKAEWFFYYDLVLGVLYKLPVVITKRWVTENGNSYIISSVDSMENGNAWTSEGIAVPIEVLKEEIPGMLIDETIEPLNINT